MQSPRRSSKQIRRNRTINSCLACRRRKIKCDKVSAQCRRAMCDPPTDISKVQPVCGNCQRSNDTCVYASEAQKAPGNSTYINDQLAEESAADPGPSSRTNSGNAAARKNSAIDGQAGLSSSPESRRASVASSAALPSIAGGETEARRQSSRGKPVAAHADKPGHLFLGDAGQSCYIGASHWAYVVDDTDGLDHLFDDIYRHGSPSPLRSSSSSQRRRSVRDERRNGKFLGRISLKVHSKLIYSRYTRPKFRQ